MRKNTWESAMTSTCALAIVLLLAIAVTQSALAQNYSIIHSFNGNNMHDGNTPYDGLTIDAAGNLYGTTCFGGANAAGTVFKLTHKNLNWVLSLLYEFHGSNDGYCPQARVVFGPDGALYGTAYEGGGTEALCSSLAFSGCGTVFKLTPPPTFCRAVSCPWTETVLYRFQGVTDGQQPTSVVTFDRSGNIYGTTFYGGVASESCGYGCGVVYKLTHSGGGWTESILYAFTDGADGGLPFDGVIFDNAGNLYGTTRVTGAGCGGTIFELTPSGSGWVEQTLLEFTPLESTVGFCTTAGLIFDGSGNLYGATNGGAQNDVDGAAFEATSSNGYWTATALYRFSADISRCGFFSCGPIRRLLMDSAGNLYGTAYGDGAYSYGSVFKLTPADNGWTYTSLHDFCAEGSPCSDGSYPISNLVFDANGNLYGTTSVGGAYGFGVVFEIAP